MAAENDAKPKKIKSGPLRQAILVVLAVVGLAIGYGFGYLFKPVERTETPGPQEATQTQQTTQQPPSKLILPAPRPETTSPATDGPVRAYEEPLPKEIVVTLDRIAPEPTRNPTMPMPGRDALMPETAAIDPARRMAWQRHAVPGTRDGRPMIAIVFDDLGIDKPRTKRALALPGPLTTSFLTYATQLEEQTALARAAGHEIWMHVPMEPGSRSIDPGPQVLLTGQMEQELAKNLRWSLERFDNYVGINNHMGSRFTSDFDDMLFVMQELRRRGLAFLDSMTSGHSQGQRAAKAAGVDYAVRNIFIDHLDEIPIIKRQLAAIETLAKKQGYAIAIGHPRENTLKAIKPWLESLDSKGFSLVPVSALLRHAEPNAGN